jgi:hypothetical protein
LADFLKLILKINIMGNQNTNIKDFLQVDRNDITKKPLPFIDHLL